VYSLVGLLLLFIVLFIETHQFFATVDLHGHHSLQELCKSLPLFWISEFEVHSLSKCLNCRTEHMSIVFEDQLLKKQHIPFEFMGQTMLSHLHLACVDVRSKALPAIFTLGHRLFE